MPQNVGSNKTWSVKITSRLWGLWRRLRPKGMSSLIFFMQASSKWNGNVRISLVGVCGRSGNQSFRSPNRSKRDKCILIWLWKSSCFSIFIHVLKREHLQQLKGMLSTKQLGMWKRFHCRKTMLSGLPPDWTLCSPAFSFVYLKLSYAVSYTNS